MKVTFYSTRGDGRQEVIAEISFSPSHGLELTGSAAAGCAELLFDQDQRDAGGAAVEQAMREAPQRFTGTYLRAVFEE